MITYPKSDYVCQVSSSSYSTVTSSYLDFVKSIKFENGFANSCVDTCVPETITVNGATVVTTCSTPVNNNCNSGYGVSASSGILEPCSGYCMVIIISTCLFAFHTCYVLESILSKYSEYK